MYCKHLWEQPNKYFDKNSEIAMGSMTHSNLLIRQPSEIESPGNIQAPIIGDLFDL
jgi:hypothetical protein